MTLSKLNVYLIIVGAFLVHFFATIDFAHANAAYALGGLVGSVLGATVVFLLGASVVAFVRWFVRWLTT